MITKLYDMHPAFDAYSDLFDKGENNMAKLSIRVFDKATETEIDSDRIGFTDIKDREHYGRKMITVAFPSNALHAVDGVEARNVGILNPDGSIIAQPGWDFKVERHD